MFCGALPTLQELVELLLIQSAAVSISVLTDLQGILDSSSVEMVLSSCCQNSDYQQLCQVNRIISADQLSNLQSTSPEVVQNACRSICSPEGPLMQILECAISHRNHLHSSYFKHSMGHFVHFSFFSHFLDLWCIGMLRWTNKCVQRSQYRFKQWHFLNQSAQTGSASTRILFVFQIVHFGRTREHLQRSGRNCSGLFRWLKWLWSSWSFD